MTFLETVGATATANILSFLIYQGIVHTGWFVLIRKQFTELLDKLNLRAKKKYGEE